MLWAEFLINNHRDETKWHFCKESVKRRPMEEKGSCRSNDVPFWLLQTDIKSSMKRNLCEPVLRHPLFFLLSSWVAIYERAWLPAAERDHDGFLFNFLLDVGGRERRREVEYSSSARKKKKRERWREREREREKRVIEESIRVARDWDPGCNDRGVFGNSDDVQRDSCFEMSTANSSALQLSWLVFLRFSSPAEFVLT